MSRRVSVRMRMKWVSVLPSVLLASLVTSGVAAQTRSSGDLPGRPSSQGESSNNKSDSSSKGSSKSSNKSGGSSSSGDPRAGKKRLDPGRRSSSSSSSSDNDSGGSTHYVPCEGECSTSTINFNGRGLFEIGGHITIADKDLALLGQELGGGGDLTLAFGPRDFPLLFGFQAGFDSFGSVTERFTFDGVNDEYDLSRTGLWGHGLVRFSPVGWPLRPYVDLVGGVWGYNVSVQDSSSLDVSIDENSTIGSGVTASYGLGVGIRWVDQSGFSLGLSALHLRGGKITAPNTNDIAVVDDVLYYGESTVGNISQWVFMLELGGASD